MSAFALAECPSVRPQRMNSCSIRHTRFKHRTVMRYRENHARARHRLGRFLSGPANILAVLPLRIAPKRSLAFVSRNLRDILAVFKRIFRLSLTPLLDKNKLIL